MQVPEGGVHVVPVTDQGHHRGAQELAELAQGGGQHRRGAAEGIAGLGIDHGHVPVLDHLFELADQAQVVGELPLADAAHIPQELFPADETVNGHHIVGPVGKDGPGGHLEIQKGVVVAEHHIRGLQLLGADALDLCLMLPHILQAQRQGQGPEIPFGGHRRRLHIKAIKGLLHGRSSPLVSFPTLYHRRPGLARKKHR